MADQKKKTPPPQAAEDVLAPGLGVSGADYGEECKRVCIEGPVTVQGPPPPPAGGTPPPPLRFEPAGRVDVQLQRSDADPSRDQAFWVAIRNSTAPIDFGHYSTFINRVLCREDTNGAEDELLEDRRPAAPSRLRFGVDAYQLLKAATEAFLILRCGIRIDEGIYKDTKFQESKDRLGFPPPS